VIHARLVEYIVGCGILIPAALAQKVEIQSDPGADFSRIHTYQWRTHPIFEKYPELKSIYATGIQLVLDAGNEQLMKRGFQPVEDSPNVFVTFFILTKEGQEIKTRYETGWGAGTYWYGVPTWTVTEVEQYLRGMLVIEILDASTSKLLWRASCGDKIKDPRNRDKNVNDAVKKAFDRFPPKSK